MIVLAETPKAGEEQATADGVRAALAPAREGGQGGRPHLRDAHRPRRRRDGSDAKFNLVGPDLSVTEWNALLKPVAGASGVRRRDERELSVPDGLAAPGRVDHHGDQQRGPEYHTVFADAFIQALTATAADQDKNGRISLLEAFVYASNLTKQSYEQRGVLPTEHAVFDDTGRGRRARCHGGSAAPWAPSPA